MPFTQNYLHPPFNGFDINSETQYPIDYIFVTTNIQVNSYQVVKQKFENRYPSDHFPVFVEVIIDKKK